MLDGRGAHRDGGDDEVRWERFLSLGPEPQPEGKARVRAADGGGEGGAVEEAEKRQRDDGRARHPHLLLCPAGTAASLLFPLVPRGVASLLHWWDGVGMSGSGGGAGQRAWGSPRSLIGPDARGHGTAQGKMRTGAVVNGAELGANIHAAELTSYPRYASSYINDT